ncbi:MAG: patatin-like phospholipase family protein [Candidatus Gastranaerophilales bacterium]|nr:patatin-like phospholipase family protein [Candidatus Gastranaerophilales bacterium]
MKNYFAIFGGGGIRGISYCGAYKALLENDIRLTGCAGSSIGAVFATMYTLGYSYDEIYEIFSNTGFDLFIDLNITLKQELALSKGNRFLDWMRDKIEAKFYKQNYKKGSMKPVTFGDIKEKLVIYSIDLTNMKFKEFSRELTPDFEIAKAVRASVSMPGLFVPLELDDNLIVDGDLLKSIPLWRATNTIKNLPERILEFRLEDNETPKKINNSIEYLNRVYNAICGFATDYIIDLYNEKDKFDYIKINTQDISVVDFLISKEKKKELFETGYKRTNDYLKNHLPQKREGLLKKYKKLFEYFTKFQKEFEKKNPFNSYLYLCEIFVFLCEEKRYLDKPLCNMIFNFKNSYLDNFKTQNFIFKKREVIDNKKEKNEKLLDIIKQIGLKVEELKN